MSTSYNQKFYCSVEDTYEDAPKKNSFKGIIKKVPNFEIEALITTNLEKTVQSNKPKANSQVSELFH